MLIMLTYIFSIKKKEKYMCMTRTCKKFLSRLKAKYTLQVIRCFNSVLKYFYTSDIRRYVTFHFFNEKCSRKSRVIKSNFIFGIYYINVHQSRLIPVALSRKYNSVYKLAKHLSRFKHILAMNRNSNLSFRTCQR